MTEHPDPAEIEAARTGESTPEVDAHLADCAQCRALRDELATLADHLAAPPAPPVPPAVEEAILWNARKEALRVRRTATQRDRRPTRRLAAWAVAAGIALALGVGGLLRLAERTDGRFAASDVNRDGVVDILDAYALALHVEHGQGRGADLNTDGRVDGADVDLAARAAVELTRS